VLARAVSLQPPGYGLLAPALRLAGHSLLVPVRGAVPAMELTLSLEKLVTKASEPAPGTPAAASRRSFDMWEHKALRQPGRDLDTPMLRIAPLSVMQAGTGVYCADAVRAVEVTGVQDGSGRLTWAIAMAMLDS